MVCNLNVDKLILLKDIYSNNLAIIAEKTVEDYADDIELLISLALQNDKVVSAKAFETDNARVFCILTVPIFLKTERDELVQSLATMLSQGKRAYISLDGDVYRKIKDTMTDEQKEQLLQIVISRQN